MEPAAPHRISIAVLLDRQPSDLAEWLADAAAFDAAGADALWIDLHPQAEADPVVLTAALAAVTHRVVLVVNLPDPVSPGATRALATLARLCRGRLRTMADGPAGATAPAEGPPARMGVAAYRRAGTEPTTFVDETDAQSRRWALTAAPDGRAAWRASLLDAGEQGLHGVVVPADPRMLDILRNPDDLGDRRDLQLTVG